jgi:hypothetical protein
MGWRLQKPSHPEIIPTSHRPIVDRTDELAAECVHLAKM